MLFRSLDEDQLMGLRKTASQYIDETRFSEPLDLIYEVLHLMLEGRRNWPLHVDFSMCIVMVARSVADGCRQRLENAPGARQSFEEMFDNDAASFGAHPSPEEELIAMEDRAVAHRAADAIRESLDDDRDGQRVLNGMLAGLSPKEACASFNLTPKAFDAAQHRVMRRLRPPRATH